jgi:hypothetical protein
MQPLRSITTSSGFGTRPARSSGVAGAVSSIITDSWLSVSMAITSTSS